MRKSKPFKSTNGDGELGLIIDEFGRAMWSANREYVVPPYSDHSFGTRFTPNMEAVWARYVEFCRRNPK